MDAPLLLQTSGRVTMEPRNSFGHKDRKPLKGDFMSCQDRSSEWVGAWPKWPWKPGVPEVMSIQDTRHGQSFGRVNSQSGLAGNCWIKRGYSGQKWIGCLATEDPETTYLKTLEIKHHHERKAKLTNHSRAVTARKWVLPTRLVRGSESHRLPDICTAELEDIHTGDTCKGTQKIKVYARPPHRRLQDIIERNKMKT